MFPCSHGNIYFLQKQERSKKIKRELLTEGDVLEVLVYGNLPYNLHCEIPQGLITS
jgi:hypothetical protein